MTYPVNKVVASVNYPKTTTSAKEEPQEEASPPLPPHDQPPAPSPALSDQMFFATNNQLHRSENQLGVLPINNEDERLLLSVFVNEQREPAEDNFYHSEHARLDYGFEPQLQLNLPDNWTLFMRTNLTLHGATEESDTTADLLADATITRNWSDTVFRLEYGATDLGEVNGDTQQSLAFTPYYRFHLYENWLMFRLGVKYSHTFNGTPEDVLTFEGKLEGDIRRDPAVGWGLQAFIPVVLNEEVPEGMERVDLAGVYAWAGGVVSSGVFLEGGLWIGGQITDSSEPAQDLIGGLNFKLKYGTEARWWQ